MTHPCRSALYGVLVFLFLLFLSHSPLLAKPLNTAVVYDGPHESFVALRRLIEQESAKLLPDGQGLYLKPENIVSADWNRQNSKRLLDKFEKDSAIDLILAIGAVSSKNAVGMKSHRKPVIATHIYNADLLSVPSEKGRSGISNLAYIDFALELGEHMRRLGEITDIKTVSLLMSPYLIDGLPDLHDALQKQASEQGFKLKIVPAANDLSAIEKEIASSDAVYLAPLSDLSHSKMQQIIKMINGLKIPSMAMIDSGTSSEGVYCSVFPKIDIRKLSRRVATFIQRIYAGENPASFPVNFDQSDKFTIDMKTAEKIGLYPSWKQMIEADLINEELAAGTGAKMSIYEVVSEAVSKSYALKAKRLETKKAAAEADEAASLLSPRLSAFARGLVIDDDRAETLVAPAERTVKFGAEIKALLYNREAMAAGDIKKILHAAKQEEERALLYDVAKEAANSYLNLLKANTLLNIKKDNLEVIRANLEIARFRENIGMSSASDVYRWEIEMASAKQALLQSSAVCKKANMALNAILCRDQETIFCPKDPDIFSSFLFLEKDRLSAYIDNPGGYKFFKDFLVKETFEHSPLLAQLDKMVESTSRYAKTEVAAKTSPTVALKGEYARTAYKAGAGKDNPALPPPINTFISYPDRNDWSVGLEVSFPIYEGGERGAKIRAAKAAQKAVESTRQSVMDKLELATRAALEDVKASYLSIALSESRAAFAEKTLEIVKNAYSNGAIGILDLIDAQNASLIAQEAVANDTFSFLSDFVTAVHAVGYLQIAVDEAARGKWHKKAEEYFKDKGLKPRKTRDF